MNSAKVQWFKNIIKNICILLLTVLVVIQTGRLWFGGVPVLDFAYILGIEHRAEGLSDAMFGLAVPRRILASEGGNVFICNYSQVEQGAQFQSARAVLYGFLQDGTHEGRFESYGEEAGAFAELLGNVLTGAALVLDYGFSMPAWSFAVVFGGNPAVLVSHADFFDMVILSPYRNGTRIVFLDTLSEVQNAHIFFTETEERIIYSGMRNRHNLFYFASVPANMEFARLVFLPQSLDGGLDFRQIRQVESIVITQTYVQEMMLAFFDNPTIVRDDVVDNNIFRFRDTYTTAIFRIWHYIEYESWGFRGNRSTDSLHEAFAEAMMFMAQDTTLVNEIYLYRYEYEGGTWRLFFNYIFDDIPVILDAQFGAELGGMEAFIEVTVRRGRVTHYKRPAIRVEARGEGGRFVVNHQIALRGQEFYENYGSIKSLELVYSLGMLESANLSYRVRTDEGNFIIWAGE